PAAGPFAGADGALDAADVLAAHQPAGAGADRLEAVDDGDVLLLPGGEVHPARHDRAGVDEHAGQVQACGRHQHPRQVLVAAGQHHRAVEPLRAHHRLDAVGDQVAGDERVVHAVVPHRDAVGDGDGAELQRVPTTGVHTLLRGLCEAVQREVAGG